MMKPILVASLVGLVLLTSTVGAAPPSVSSSVGASNAILHNRRPAVRRHNDNNSNDQQQLTRVDEQRSLVEGEESSCPGTPFLWKITDDDNGKHVGFAVGTMNLPGDVVLTAESWKAIGHAIEDSCDVYGELNTHSPNVTAALQTCQASIESLAITVDDLPSQPLKAAIRTKLIQILTSNNPTNDTSENIEIKAGRLGSLPLAEVQQLILYGNTEEYVVRYGYTLYSDDGPMNLDTNMLKLGRPADDLEEVSVQCDYLEALHPAKETFLQNFDDQISADIEASLEASLTQEIQLYKCGDIDTFVERVNSGTVALDEDTNAGSLADRNKKMAIRIDDILKNNPRDRILFAVGVSHWLVGDDNLQKLLKEGYGYTLEHIPDWDKELAVDHDNDHCEVMFHPEMGLYVDNPSVPGAAPVDITSEPTHALLDSTYFTNPPTAAGDAGATSPTDGMVLIPTTASPTSKPATSSGAAIGVASKTVPVAVVAGIIHLSLLWCA
eukprot:CAMPEP_0181134872 /NCGR_PEP_ID=MMETSP1071-20121207/32320_1 /TAXON_ID=35127 /ORGANISM="Thalassiosira sp., Strain NH16" /LENGTH=495 /DNA_ID=CAMNT_0023221421 /DNA_START=42 /DNA_END=1529 /DNA_ORIENTATION=-